MLWYVKLRRIDTHTQCTEDSTTCGTYVQRHSVFTVKCPPGRFTDIPNNRCVPCGPDTYQNIEWQEQCNDCPTSFGTLDGVSGADDISLCFGECKLVITSSMKRFLAMSIGAETAQNRWCIESGAPAELFPWGAYKHIRFLGGVGNKIPGLLISVICTCNFPAASVPVQIF